MASSLYKFAEEFRTEVESAIKSELSKRAFLESVVFRVSMPLTVNVVTDQGAVSLTILKDGNVQLSESLFSNPDNTIQANFQTLKDLYYSRDRNQFIRAETEGRIKITSNSLKGQQAERKLRDLLGR